MTAIPLLKVGIDGEPAGLPGGGVGRTLRACAVLLLGAFPVLAPAQESLARFGWFATVVGSCWEATLPDGKTRHTHCYTSQFGKFIRGTAKLAGDHNGTLQDQFFGDSVFAWDEENQRITYYIWASDGSHGRHEAMYEDGDLAFPVRSKKDPTKVSFRSLWHRVDADSFEVRRQVPDGSGWKTELTVLYSKAPQQ